MGDAAATGSWTWDLTMMYAIHDAFRRDLRRLEQAVRGFSDDPSGTPARRAALAERWEFVALVLHHHHQAEDDLLWPLVRSRTAHDATAHRVLDQMAAEHATIDPRLERIGAGFAALRSGSLDAAGRRALADELAAAGRDLGAHLDHEETDAVPLLERHVDRTSARAFEDQQRRSMDREQSAKFLPWVADGQSGARAGHVWGKLPGPVRFVLRPKWSRAYRAWDAAAFG